MSVKAKTNLLVDIVILIAFIVANNPSLTGLPVHEWFAVGAGLVLFAHLLFHWDWVVSMTKRYILKPVLSIFGSRKQPQTAPAETSKAVH